MSIIGTKEAEVTILINESLSAAVECGGFDVLRVVMPAGWDAADITFQVSDDGGTTFRNLYWDWGAEMAIDAAAGRVIELSPFVLLQHIDQIRVRSGTSGVAVSQSTARTLYLVLGVR